jgi:hypothetical protein
MTRHFWYGFLFCVCCFGMHQDWLGLEAYLNYCTTNWRPLPWWLWLIPMAFFLLAEAGLVLMRREATRGRQ